MKVLLADDSMTIRMILKNLLKELGITDITEGSNGQEALDFLNQSTFDLILTDIHMPKVDGLTVLEEIKKNPDSTHKFVPVVVISSDTDYRQIERAKNLGAFGYIKKPFKQNSLQAAIRAAQDAEERRKNEASSEIEETTKSSEGSYKTEANRPATTIKTAPASSPPASSSATPKKGGLFGWIRSFLGKS